MIPGMISCLFERRRREEASMSSDLRNRSIDAISAALAGLVFVAAVEALFAQTASKAEPSKQPETFTGTTVNLSPGAGETMSIHILRWSPEADRDRLAAAFKEKGDAGLQAALEAAPTLGIVWTGESLGTRCVTHIVSRCPTGASASSSPRSVGWAPGRAEIRGKRPEASRRRRTTRSPWSSFG